MGTLTTISWYNFINCVNCSIHILSFPLICCFKKIYIYIYCGWKETGDIERGMIRFRTHHHAFFKFFTNSWGLSFWNNFSYVPSLLSLVTLIVLNYNPPPPPPPPPVTGKNRKGCDRYQYKSTHHKCNLSWAMVQPSNPIHN